jgi:hypothetical protein
VAAVVLADARAQKTDPFHAIEVQLAADGNVRAVQVIPSGEVAAAELLLLETIQNVEPLHAIATQLAEDGNVCAVQVMPSGDVAAAVLF